MISKNKAIVLSLALLIQLMMLSSVHATSPVIVSSDITPTIAYTNDTLVGFCNATDTNLTNISYRIQIFKNNVLNLTPDFSCYQESANQSTSCGGLSTGNYFRQVGADWLIANSSSTTNLSDGDYSSYRDTSGGQGGLLVNYTKMNSVVGVVWQLAYNHTGKKLNITLNDSCVARTDVIMVRFQYETPLAGQLKLSCYNSTSEEVVIGIYDNSGQKFYEEALYQIRQNSYLPNISVNAYNISPSQTQKGENWTLSCQAYEILGNTNSSWLNSTGKIIANSVPVVTLAVLNSTTNDVRTNLTLYCSAYDIDDENVTYGYQLFNNGTVNLSLYPPAYESPCYQESANESSSCGATNSGAYQKNNYFWNINYTIPSTSNNAIWQVKHGYLGIYNVTIPNACMSDTLQLTMFSANDLNNKDMSYGACFDYSNSNWTNITTIVDTPTSATCSIVDNNSFIDGDFSTGEMFQVNSNQWTNVVCLGLNSFIYEEGIYWQFGVTNNVTNLVKSVQNTSLTKGQNWTGTCYATDGFENSTFVNTTSLTINNTPPSILNASGFVVLVSGGANCTYTYEDVDTDIEAGSTYRWFKNGVVLSSTVRVLSSGNYTSGDSLICEVRPSDGTDFGALTNSSTFVTNDSIAPLINSVSVQSSGLITTPITISLNCTDANPLANGFPKAQWTNPNSIVEGNFTMTLNGATGLYEKSYTYSIVGTYTNFTFYCADGSGNLNTTLSNVQLVISASGAATVTGGGGGLPDLPTVSEVNFEVTPVAKQATAYVGINNIEEFQIINKGTKDIKVNITALSALSDQNGYTFIDFTKTKQQNVNVIVPASSGLLTGTSYIRYSIIPPSGTLPGTYYVKFDVTSGSVTKTHTVTMKVQSNIFSPVVALWNKELFSTEVPCQDAFEEPAATAGQVCEPLSVGLKAGTLFLIVLLISFIAYVVVNVKKKRGAY